MGQIITTRPPVEEGLKRRIWFLTSTDDLRSGQKELLLPSSITLVDEDGSSLHNLLEEMAGFAIVELNSEFIHMSQRLMDMQALEQRCEVDLKIFILEQAKTKSRENPLPRPFQFELRDRAGV
jgi:hypothetical protein